MSESKMTNGFTEVESDDVHPADVQAIVRAERI